MRTIATLGVIAVLAIAVSAPSEAQGIQTPFFRAKVDRITPKCRNNPDAPVVGRVAGNMSGRPTRGVSFVGCFQSFNSCEAWRMRVSAQIGGRLHYNRCENR